MPISRDEVRRIAALARLDLGDDEVDRLAGELSDILAHFELLRSAEYAEGAESAEAEGAAGEESLTAERAESAEGTTDRGRLRPDEPVVDRLDAGPGAMAPGWTAGFFTVPRLASHEGVDSEDPADGAETREPVDSAEPAKPSQSEEEHG